MNDRSWYLGGTDAPAILGLSPWRTPLDVYLEKVGEGSDETDTPAMRWGRILEDVLADEYSRMTGNKVRRKLEAIIHPKYNFIAGRIDRQVVRKPIILEVKTTSRKSDEWGEPWTDDIPEHYIIQVQHYMGIANKSIAHIAVLFMMERDFKIYEVKRDDDLIKELFDQEVSFWRNHIEKRVPPDPVTSNDIRKRWRMSVPNSVVVANSDVSSLANELAELKRRIKSMQEREKEIVALIQEYMEDSERLEDTDGSLIATWKNVVTKRVDTKILRKEFPEAAQKCEKEVSYRRFDFKYKLGSADE